jgi:small subunit ribosomal protein S16
MSVRIRLRRVGRKKQPYFRVVATKGDAPRDGAYIEALGFYNPRTRPAYLTMDLEKVDEWIRNGAQVTDSAMSLIRKARKGGDSDVTFVKPGEEAPRLKTATKPERRPAASEAAPAAEEAPEAEAPEAEAAKEEAPEAEAATEEAPEAEAAKEEAPEAEAVKEEAPEAEEAEEGKTEAQAEAETESEAEAEEKTEAKAGKKASAKADEAEAEESDEAEEESAEEDAEEK